MHNVFFMSYGMSFDKEDRIEIYRQSVVVCVFVCVCVCVRERDRQTDR